MNKKIIKDNQDRSQQEIEISLICSKSDDVATMAVQTMNALSKHKKNLSQDNGLVKTVKIFILCFSSCSINKNHFSEIITRQGQALFPKAETIIHFENVSSEH